MIIKKHVIIYLLIIGITVSSTSTREFSLSLWKDYHLNSPHLVLSDSSLTSSVAFLDRPSKEWVGEYRFAEQLIYAEFKNGNEVLQLIGNGSSLIVKGLKQDQRIILSLPQEGHQILVRKNGSIAEVPMPYKGQLVVRGFDQLIYRKWEDFGNNFEAQRQRIIIQSQRKLDELHSLFKINSTYKQFGRSMLSKTISQLCVQSHQDLSFIGICYNIHQGKRHLPYYKIDIRFSPLIVDRLFGVYPKTALFLFEELIGLLEDQIFYSDLPFVQIPEHISIIKGFVSTVKLGGYNGTELKGRVKQLLNGLMNQMLLSQVNHLQEEINYRENKKMHPTLIKMVSLKWQSHSRKNALSSIYEESFTPDYFYNHANQHIDSCVSKVAWLTAATAEFVLFVKATGNQDDFDALEQSTSLYRILQQVSGGDNHAKQGRYYSINAAEGVRVYAQQVGYESFLPYIYELSSIFPQEFLKNVTTSNGLASLNLNHDKFSSKFQFRGNVHLYFNYKILFQARRRLQASRHQRALQAVQELINMVRQKINSFWTLGKSFTSWTVSGQGVRERKGLSLLSLLIMGERR